MLYIVYYVHIYVHVYMCMYMFICAYICACLYIYMCMFLLFIYFFNLVMYCMLDFSNHLVYSNPGPFLQFPASLYLHISLHSDLPPFWTATHTTNWWREPSPRPIFSWWAISLRFMSQYERKYLLLLLFQCNFKNIMAIPQDTLFCA